jgi:hypothetical protein
MSSAVHEGYRRDGLREPLTLGTTGAKSWVYAIGGWVLGVGALGIGLGFDPTQGVPMRILGVLTAPAFAVAAYY